MKGLAACEFSQIVTREFRKRGHEFYSCDILPTEGNPKWHIQANVLTLLDDYWDILIAFPPCTDLAVSGARWFKEKAESQKKSIEFFMKFQNLNHIPKVSTENPIGIMSRLYRKPDQIIQPWMFGHPETKSTCLWLKGLPLLVPTKIVMPMFHTVHKEPPGPDRWKNRSRTFKGIAEAMANQWGN